MTEESKDTKSVQRERQKLLKKAQRFVYPVGATRRKIAIISTVVFIVFVVAFTTLSASLVYIFRDESEFTYQVNRIIPFPIGRVGNNLVTYEEYLFEFRDDLHFLREYGDLDPASAEFESKADEIRQLAEARVYRNALAENIAREHGIEVSQDELQNRVSNLRAQAGGLDGIDQLGEDQAGLANRDNPRFEEIIAQYYNWSMRDLERDLTMQLLKSKLPAIIDYETREEAENVQEQAQSGNQADFRKLAEEYSQDTSSPARNGRPVNLDNRNSILFPEAFNTAVEQLEDGEVSELIETDFGLHIIRRINTTNQGVARIAHILFQYQDADKLLDEQFEQTDDIHKFIDIN